jgi:5,10-methylenetetrahydromethanopterin reductase
MDYSINVFLDLPVSQMVEIAQEAERQGFKKYWAYDEGLITRDPYITLAAVAQKTDRIMLGTGITNPYTRHAGITAASIASLDELSNGRAFLGIGAGGSLTLDPLGIVLKKPLTATRETITSARALYKKETVTLDGAMVRFDSARIDYGRDDIAIYLAGRGPKMLAMGGELADGVVLDFVYKESFAYWVDLIQSGAERSGNSPKLCYSTPIVTSDKTLEEVRPHMTYRLVNTPVDVQQKIGMTRQDVETIRQAMAHGLEEAGKYVKDEWVSPFVIMGSIDECAAELRELVNQFQIDEFLVPILNTAEAARLMSEVQPVLEKM